MNYFSTRDKSLEFSFKDIFLRGLAPGGGLFLPAEIKKYSQEELNNLSQLNYNELATEIIFNFCSGEIKKEELSSLIQKSYSSFKDKEVVNIKKIGNIKSLYNGWVLPKFFYNNNNFSVYLGLFGFFILKKPLVSIWRCLVFY